MAKRTRVMDSPERSQAPGDALGRQQALELILRERRRLLRAALTMHGATPDPIEAANEVEEEQVWLAVLDQSREMQVQVDEAMRLLAEGRYGVCVSCGRSIPPARLRALPFALRCLPCQERYETRRALSQSQAAAWGRMRFNGGSGGPDEP